jgi:DNA-directed RNA polymerase subunit RPC12/RpoP
MIRLVCPTCRKPFKEADDFEGDFTKCPSCGQVIGIIARKPKKDEDESEDERRRGKKRSKKNYNNLLLTLFAAFFVIGGGWWLVHGLIMETHLPGAKVYNIGLLNEKQNSIIGGLLGMGIGVFIKIASLFLARKLG